MSDTSDTADRTMKRVPFLGSIAAEGTVIVEVGSLSKEFQVHKSLLVLYSEYFRKALEGPWKESEEQTITLEDVEPRIFAVFVHWLYTKEFLLGEDELGMPITDVEHAEAEALETCTKAYIFGDRFLAPEFRRAANNCFADAMRHTYVLLTSYTGTLAHAFENIPADRVIVQALVDDYCACWNGRDDSIYGPTTMSCFPPAILRCMIDQMRDEYLFVDIHKGRCYLEHASDEEMKACADMHMRWDEETELAFFE